MKICNKEDIKELLKDNMTIMIGGFMANGTPEILIDCILEKNCKNLTIICNDAGLPGKGVERIVRNGNVTKLIASHIGLTPIVAELMNSDKMDVTLVPQGSLAEKIRSKGAGLGGVLTKTGIGTSVAEGKEIITIDGEEYLLEKPLSADIAFIRGTYIDKAGNVFYKGTTRNFNPLMAMAADIVVAACEKIVEVGEIQKESIVTPCIFVDYVVEGEI